MSELKLDESQEEIVRQTYIEFERKLISTESIDFEKAKVAIRSLYNSQDFEAPKNFFKVSSPIEALILIYNLCKRGESDLIGKFWENIQKGLQFNGYDWGDADNEYFLEILCLDPGNLSLAHQINNCLLYFDDEIFENAWQNASKILKEFCEREINNASKYFISANLVYDNNYIVGYRSLNWVLAECARRINAPISKKTINELEILNEIISSCGKFFLYEDFAIICERPVSIHTDEIGRLHCEGAMALSYSDGSGIYSLKGINVPKFAAISPNEITVRDVIRERNIETRRILIELMGSSKLAASNNAKIIHEDIDDLGNPRRLLKVPMDEGDWYAVEVTDSSKTQDSHGNWVNKKYVLAVNPDHYDGRAGRECHAAIASTWRHGYDNTQLFFEKPEGYKLEIET